MLHAVLPIDTQNTLKYHLVTAEPSFTVKMMTICTTRQCLQEGNWKGWVCYPHIRCLLSRCWLLCQSGSCVVLSTIFMGRQQKWTRIDVLWYSWFKSTAFHIYRHLITVHIV